MITLNGIVKWHSRWHSNQKQHYASQPKNSTATRKRTGYRAMYKTDTHSNIIF